MKTVRTFTATIWVGFKERDTGLIHGYDEAFQLCRDYCDKVGMCVSLTPTTFVYTHGFEQGVSIGLINYPRFPDTQKNIRRKALELAEILLNAFKQYKVSVVCSGKTYMLERDKVTK